VRDLLFRNIGLKLLSLLFAVSLWLFVNLKATADRELQLPVRWVNLPDFFEITNPVNDFIRIRVTGPRRILSHLNPKRFPVTLDLSDAKVGLRDYQISDKMISLIPGLKATVLPPDTIQFKFDLIVTKGVSVHPQLTGKLPEGFILKHVSVSPGRIEIIGAESEVKGIQQVETNPLKLDNLLGSVEEKVQILLNRPHVWPSSGQDSVTVRLDIEETLLRKIVRQVPVRVRMNGDTGSARVQPPRVDVLVEGLAGKIHSLTPDQVEVVATLSENQVGTFPLPIAVHMELKGIRAECKPAQVVVTVSGPQGSN